MRKRILLGICKYMLKIANILEISQIKPKSRKYIFISTKQSWPLARQIMSRKQLTLCFSGEPEKNHAPKKWREWFS